jgi:hypothetical protein
MDNAVIIDGCSANNMYYISKDDPEISFIEIGHYGGHYAAFILVDTRFVPALQNFNWIGGYKPGGGEKEYLTACINQTNRQVLERLNIRNIGKTIQLHKFIVMLASGSSDILKINHIGDTWDNRIKKLQWVTQADYDTSRAEFFHFIERRHM